jgi:hypothetical protein
MNLRLTVEVRRIAAELYSTPHARRDEHRELRFSDQDAGSHPGSQRGSPPAEVVFGSSTPGTWAPRRQSKLR